MSVYTKAYTNKRQINEKTRQISMAKEEEKRIASMGLGELKEYACPKSLQHNKDWYMTCVSCPGVDNCKPGRRVMEILENDTKPDEKVSAVDKFYNRYGNDSDKKALTLRGKDAYLDVIKHDDPLQYYIDLHNVPRATALERFRRWKVMYPDVEAPSFEKIRLAAWSKSETNEYVKDLTEHVRQNVKSAFTYPDGVFAYFRNVLNVNARNVIRSRVYNWMKAYPDLNEEYRISKWVEATRGTPGSRNLGFDEPEGFLPNIKQESDDEVSVDDFLAEMDKKKSEPVAKEKPEPVVKEEPVKKPEKVIKEEPVKKPEKVIKQEPVKKNDTVSAEDTIPLKQEIEKIEKEVVADKVATEKQNRITACLVFTEKRKEIAAAVNELDAEIRQKQKELVDLKDKLNKLDDAAEIMGFVKVVHK